MLLKALKEKPWNWFDVAKCSWEGDSAALRSSSSVVKFGEDPVTQMEDLVVIKDAALVCTSRTTKPNSVCIAQPWTHTFCQTPTALSHLVEGRAPEYHNFHSALTPQTQTLPCYDITHQPLLVRLRAQHYQLLAEMHFFMIYLRRDGHFQPWISSSVNPLPACTFSSAVS